QEMENNEKLPFEATNSSHASLEFGICFSDDVNEKDEWCDFKEDHDQPFPNLVRNSKLVLSPTDVATTEDVKMASEHSQYQDTGGDSLGVGSSTEESTTKAACPWLKVEQIEISNCSLKIIESVDRKPKPANATQSNIAVKKSVYVPPALRESQSEMNVRPKKQVPSGAAKLPKGQAPDINNVDFFPSLCHSHISKRAK
ncbi:hypothetical protein KR044_006816, partial [Drosophila immigrans]